MMKKLLLFLFGIVPCMGQSQPQMAVPSDATPTPTPTPVPAQPKGGSQAASISPQPVAPSRAANIGDVIYFTFAKVALKADPSLAPLGPDAPKQDAVQRYVTVAPLTYMTCISIVSENNDYKYYCRVIRISRDSAKFKPFSNTEIATPDDVVIFSEKELLSAPPYTYGLAYGLLYIPFKFHPGNPKDISTGSSVGGYVGYKHVWGSSELNYIIFAGLTSISVQQSNNNTTNNQNITGFSGGSGVLLNLGGSFHGGLVYGWDYVSSSANYTYNGKPWFAIEFGFDFTKPK
jgi:hypothetical protein